MNRLFVFLLLSGVLTNGRSLLSQDVSAIKESGKRLLDSLSAVGARYDVIESGTHNRMTYFAGADSIQLGLGVGVDLIKVLGDFEPLVMDNLDLVGEQGSQFFCVKALPTTRIGILHFDLPGHWPCAYHKTADSKYIPKTQFIPALNAERKHGFTTPTTLDIVFDQKKEWKKLESTKGGRFLIQSSSSREFKTKSGIELKLHPCTIVQFDSGERGLPSKAWETSEWEIDGRRYLLPPETSSKIWECDDWREIAPSIEFPFSFQITIQDSNISLASLLDDDTGVLERLKKGTLAAKVTYSKVSEIAISTLKLFPKNQDFFILPPKGCYVRDIDSDKPWYIEGEPQNP